MKILEKEIGLRNETRAAQQARPQLEADAFAKQVAPLAKTQLDVAKRTTEVVQKIRDLADGEAKFGKEIALLSRVAEVMQEAHGLLARPQTGPATIAAQTEAIELLLQAKRVNPKGGGGGGGSSPGGGGTGDTEASALALLGQGNETTSKIDSRAPEQATGVTGSQYPAEFRAGLDAYFNSLEGDGAGGSD